MRGDLAIDKSKFGRPVLSGVPYTAACKIAFALRIKPK